MYGESASKRALGCELSVSVIPDFSRAAVCSFV